MFHKELNRKIDAVDKRVDYTKDEIRANYWTLRRDLDLLIEALGMVKDEQHIHRYIKKGGPEHG